jgi:hypothetical protein
MTKVTSEVPAEKLELYMKLVATVPGVPLKGATIPYTSANGHMFSYLSKAGKLELRLPAKVREAFLLRYNAALTRQYGVVQKEYVEVPEVLFENTTELQEYFGISFAYVSSLKPKPTTRKKENKG